MITRSMLVKTDTLAAVAAILTGSGKIVSIDHEGTIVYELEGEDALDLGRMASEIEQEMRSVDSGAQIVKVGAAR